MSNPPRVVCWASRDEWTEIYQCLYSFDDVDSQRKGVDRVMAWKSRSGGKLPLAIECTVDLVLAHLADSLSFTPEVQLIVSMALVRFVNGMVDLNQKGLYARSVQAIAEEIGLPDWLVDLRHEATHANLPSQNILRAGINVALSWLREEYWEAQIKMHQDSEERLLEMLESYQVLSTKKNDKKKIIERQEQKVKNLAQEITNFVATNNLWSFLQTSLLKNGFLSVAEDNNTSLVQATAPSIQLTDKAIKIWKPLFEALDRESPDFIPFFLVSILDPQSVHLENDTKNQNHWLLWALWLLQSSSSSTFTAKLPWLTLLELCLKNPNSFTKEFVDLILNEVSSIPKTLKQNIHLLLNIKSIDNSLDNSPNEAYKCRSLEQIINTGVMKSVQQPLQDNPCTSEGWSVSGVQTKWHLIPFGEVLGCEFQSVNLLELPVQDPCAEKQNPQNQNSSNSPNSCRDNLGDGPEIFNEYNENELSDEMEDKNAVSCSDDSVLDTDMNIESESFNKELQEIEVCLF